MRVMQLNVDIYYTRIRSGEYNIQHVRYSLCLIFLLYMQIYVCHICDTYLCVYSTRNVYRVLITLIFMVL